MHVGSTLAPGQNHPVPRPRSGESSAPALEQRWGPGPHASAPNRIPRMVGNGGRAAVPPLPMLPNRRGLQLAAAQQIPVAVCDTIAQPCRMPGLAREGQKPRTVQSHPGTELPYPLRPCCARCWRWAVSHTKKYFSGGLAAIVRRQPYEGARIGVCDGPGEVKTRF